MPPSVVTLERIASKSSTCSKRTTRRATHAAASSAATIRSRTRLPRRRVRPRSTRPSILRRRGAEGGSKRGGCMKLGLALPWANPKVRLPVERVQRAERLGFDSVWTAEIYGQDAITPLAFLAAHTRRIRLGTAVIQAAARTPAATALAMATVDQLAGGGRVIIGVGLSGPQIVEGWYGQPWGDPRVRLRDYVTIVRKVLRREGPVAHDGKEIALPYRGPGSSGLGKPLKSVLHTDPSTPIYLGTGTPANVKLTA